MDCDADDIEVTPLMAPSMRSLPDILGGTKLHVDDRGLSINGQLRFGRGQLRSTHLQKLPDGRVAACFTTSLATVRATLPDEPTARALCAALGAEVSDVLPEGATVARHFGFAATTRQVLASFVAASVAMVLAGLGLREHFTVFLALAVMAAAVALAWSAMLDVSIGVDGVDVRRRGRSRFVRFEDIASIDAHPESVAIALRSGEAIHIHVPFATSDESIQRHRDRIAASLTRSLAAYAETLVKPDHAAVGAVALLARGERPVAQWLVGLRELTSMGSSAYREVELPIDELWRVVEDATAEPTARAGAAVVLRATLDESGRTRLRVASEGTASPKIRVVLEAVTGENDAALERALAEVAADAAAT